MLVAPILPMITDDEAQLITPTSEIAAAGTTGATVFALLCVPVAERFMRYLFRYHPACRRVRRAVPQGLLRQPQIRQLTSSQRSSVLLRKHGLDRKDTMLRIPDTQPAPIPPHLALSEPSLF